MTKEFDEVMASFDNVNLHEDVFDVDEFGAEDYIEFRDDDEADKDEFVDVVDVDAEDEEELDDSYLGDVVLSCVVCHTPIFKNKDEVEIEVNEDGEEGEETIADVGEECPVCGATNGFHVCGVVTPYVETEVEVDDKEEAGEKEPEDKDTEEEGEANDEEEKEVNEALQKAINKFALNEDAAEVKMDGEDVTVETNGVTVTVGSGETGDMGIEPIEDEEEFFADETEGDEEADVDIDEIGEDEVEEAFVRAKPYFSKFKLKEAYHHNGKIVVEGLAKTKRGKIVREKFALKPLKLKGNRAAFMVEGFGSHKGVVGRVDNGKLMVESFVGKREQKRR